MKAARLMSAERPCELASAGRVGRRCKRGLQRSVHNVGIGKMQWMGKLGGGWLRSDDHADSTPIMAHGAAVCLLLYVGSCRRTSAQHETILFVREMDHVFGDLSFETFGSAIM